MIFFFFFFFLNLKKSYDPVPHIYYIIMKTHHLGIRGKVLLNFIVNLFLSSKASVRVDGQLSGFIKY